MVDKIECFIDIPDLVNNTYSHDEVMNPYLGYEEIVYHDQFKERVYIRSPEYINHYLHGQYEDQTSKSLDYFPSVKPDFDNGTTWYVDDIPGEGPGNPPENYTNIQDAINNADHGDTIYVHIGLYIEHIKIEKSLIIKGEDKTNTCIDGNGSFVKPMIEIYKIDWVTINSLTLQNGYGLFIRYSSNSTITNNRFISTGISFWGFQLQQWNSHTIQNNTANGKPIRYYKNMENINIPSNTAQVILANCSQITIKNLNLSNTEGGILIGFSSNISIAENIVTNINGYGIIIIYSSKMIIKNNSITNSGYTAINLRYSSEIMIRKNYVSDNYYFGITLSHSSNISISDNIVRKSKGNPYGMGISISTGSSENYICRNIIEDNLKGIMFYIAIENIIEENTIRNNHDGIYIYFGSNNNTIIANNITNNQRQGIYSLSQSSALKILNNTITNNLNGILLTESSDNKIIGNFCENNVIDGIGITDRSNNNTIKQNICSKNMKGITLRSLIKKQESVYISFNNKIINNYCENNQQGILLNNGFYNTISENQLSHNGIGIYLYGSSINSIENNLIYQNSHKGITLRQYSIRNTIKNNQIGPWNYQGIYIEKSHFNKINHNNITKNNDDGIGIVQTIGNQINYNNFIKNTNFEVEGFLCYDNARFNYWNGYLFPYIRVEIFVGGFIRVHPCLKQPLDFNYNK
jgi:parallel beta-helix repeat protein